MNKVLFFLVNFLTLIRIVGTCVLIPIFKIYGGIVTAIVSAICYFTDFLDGIIARKTKCATFWGSIFDSIADKLFTIINLVLMFFITKYALIPILLEVLTIIIQWIRFKHNSNVQANVFGKLKMWITAFTMVSLFVMVDKGFNSLQLTLTLIPLIVSELFVIFTYLISRKQIGKNRLDEKEKIINDEYLKTITFRQLLFDPKLYIKYKDIDSLYTLAKAVNNSPFKK